MVEDFIRRRWQVNSHFLDGNCLWFAIILTIRFPELEIYYLPIQGHFIVGKNNTYYDWTGKIIPKEEPLLFEDIKQTDPLWYSYLIRDCFN
jgi:hypothetical protein